MLATLIRLRHQTLSRYWLLISVGLILFFSYFRQDLFFCDYAIIWDAAYRMNQGHVIYKDFYTPTGPVSFLLPYLSFKIFGYSYESLKITQVVISISIAIAYHYLLKAVTADTKLRNVNYWIFLALFLLPLGFPWYNTTALMFSIWALFLIVSSQSYLSILGAASLLALAILSKQDYGLMGLFVCIGLIFANQFQSKIKSPIAILKASYLKITLLILASLLPIAIYALVSEDFVKHFNFGSQYGGTASRLKNLFGTGTSYVFFITTALGVYVYYKRQNLFIALSVLLLIYATVVRATSGLSHISATFYVASLVCLIYYFYKSLESKKFILLLSFLIVPLAVFMLAKPVRNLISTAGVLFNKENVLTFNYAKVEAKNLHLLELSSGSIYINNESREYVSMIETYLLSENIHKKKNISLLNITELTYLNHHFGLPTPKGLPLWFHEGITFGPQDYKYLEEKLDLESYDIVLLDKSQDFINAYYAKSPKYELISKRSYLSPLQREMIAYVKK